MAQMGHFNLILAMVVTRLMTATGGESEWLIITEFILTRRFDRRLRYCRS